ncbi:MAG TPA: aspartate carbamoyltransferase catalytic subunit [Candidatus Limnocylindrales bacterium]|jgi:aspartate carbamoyltransferase catalytic subunit
MTADPRHLLDVDEWSDETIEAVLDNASRARDAGERPGNELLGCRVVLLFAEPSTRTRMSFEMAARGLSAETYVVDPASSSMVKGETLVDTVRNLDALGVDMIVMRHHRAGAPWVVARHFGGAVVNAGDGWHAHPTQALLDLLTLRRAFGGSRDALRGRKIAIVGDLLHSRVARSNVWTLTRAGADVWVSGPDSWLRGYSELPVTTKTDLEAALDGASAVMGLRVQKERMRGSALSIGDYIARYQITEERLVRFAPEARYLHPGPINEGVEVTRAVARGPRSLVLEQVANGLAVRMAVLALLAPSTPRGLRGPTRAQAGSSTRDLPSAIR